MTRKITSLEKYNIHLILTIFRKLNRQILTEVYSDHLFLTILASARHKINELKYIGRNLQFEHKQLSFSQNKLH